MRSHRVRDGDGLLCTTAEDLEKGFFLGVWGRLLAVGESLESWMVWENLGQDWGVSAGFFTFRLLKDRQ
jgi:hypothetical protein